MSILTRPTVSSASPALSGSDEIAAGRMEMVSHNPMLGPALVVIATLFNLLLCFVNTRHLLTVGNVQISVIQIAIFACGVYVVRRDIDEPLVVGGALLVGAVIGLRLFNPEVDPKILFDIGMVPLFLLIGRASSIAQADKVVTILIVVVLAVGCFEFAAPSLYERVFDIRDYYLNKGAIDPTAVNYGDSSFFTSGERSDSTGRNMFAGLLGAHRVSSVFLEPVSMGNFPIVCLIWLLSAPRLSRGRQTVLALSVFVCIILPDSRFAAGCAALMLLAWTAGGSPSKLAVLFLPVVIVGALCLFGTTHITVPGMLPSILTDDLPGRLRFSGALLDSWTMGEWLGLQPSAVYTSDTGFAYVFNQLGLPVAFSIWAGFSLARARSAWDVPCRLYVAIYAAASLCVGASLFSIKTGAFLWFLVGACQTARTFGDGTIGNRSSAASRDLASASITAGSLRTNQTPL